MNTPPELKGQCHRCGYYIQQVGDYVICLSPTCRETRAVIVDGNGDRR